MKYLLLSMVMFCHSCTICMVPPCKDYNKMPNEAPLTITLDKETSKYALETGYKIMHERREANFPRKGYYASTPVGGMGGIAIVFNCSGYITNSVNRLLTYKFDAQMVKNNNFGVLLVYYVLVPAGALIGSIIGLKLYNWMRKHEPVKPSDEDAQKYIKQMSDYAKSSTGEKI